MDNIDLKRIKKHYGENFAKLCRELFPTILETPGALSKIIFEKFDTSPTLYEDVLEMKYDFKTFIYRIFNPNRDIKDITGDKSAKQLLDEAGYILYPECQTEDDIQSFKKYYSKHEELCTFNGGRLDSCRVWFAVKKDVDKIKREDFTEPQRQDEYGTSVISIQFTKESRSTLSIKNRYNHTVENPDATFGNDLDNIIPGLTDAFCRDYDISLSYGLDGEIIIDGYVMANNGKYYKSNVFDWTADFCANNIIVKTNREVVALDKSKCLLVENYLIDIVNKRIKNLTKEETDNFAESIGEIKSIHISLDQNKNKVINITPVNGEDVQIIVNKSNRIIEYTNKNIVSLGKRFMCYCTALEKLNLPNVKEVGDYLLEFNENLVELNMPKLESVGSHFLEQNHALKILNTPNLKIAGDCFLLENFGVEELDLPKLERVGDKFFVRNQNIKKLAMPNLMSIGNNFLCCNTSLTDLDLPNLKSVGDNFLFSNRCLNCLKLPKIHEVGKGFLANNYRYDRYTEFAGGYTTNQLEF